MSVVLLFCGLMDERKRSSNTFRLEVPAPRADKMRTVKITPAKQKEMKNILGGMQKELGRIDRIREKIRHEKISFYTPQQNKKIIEEIEIPPLKLFREERKKS